MSKIGTKLANVLKEAAKHATVWVRRPEVLLGARVPQPMHGTAPRTVLGQKWWDAERRAAYQSTDFHCVACGVHKDLAACFRWLEAHETYVIDYAKGLMRYVEAVPLCHYCHNYIHAGRLQAMLDAGKIAHGKYAAVIQHGDRVLKQAGLTKIKPYSGPFAAWGKWRLAIGRRRYKGLFKNEAAWAKYHEDKNAGVE